MRILQREAAWSLATASEIRRDGFLTVGQTPRRSPVRSWKDRPTGRRDFMYCGCCGAKTKIYPHRDQFHCRACGVLAAWDQPIFSTPFIKT